MLLSAVNKNVSVKRRIDPERNPDRPILCFANLIRVVTKERPSPGPLYLFPLACPGKGVDIPLCETLVFQSLGVGRKIGAHYREFLFRPAASKGMRHRMTPGRSIYVLTYSRLPQ